MFNKLTMLGNITKDIELKYTQSGSAVASSSIATSHKYTSNGEKKEETTFIDVTWFGRSAEIANQYLRKGSKVFAEGRLKQESWNDKDTGQKRYKMVCIIETFKILDSKQDGEKQSYTPPEPQYEQHPQYQKPQQREMPQNNLPEIDIYEDEIPF